MLTANPRAALLDPAAAAESTRALRSSGTAIRSKENRGKYVDARAASRERALFMGRIMSPKIILRNKEETTMSLDGGSEGIAFAFGKRE